MKIFANLILPLVAFVVIIFQIDLEHAGAFVAGMCLTMTMLYNLFAEN